MSYQKNLDEHNRQTTAILRALTDLHGVITKHTDTLPLAVSNALLQCNKKLEEATAEPEEQVHGFGDHGPVMVQDAGD